MAAEPIAPPQFVDGQYPPLPQFVGYAQPPVYDDKGFYPPSYPGYAQPLPAGTTVVVNQPGPPAVTVVNQPPGIKPNNYIALSIFNLICCWFMVGIMALIFSIMVDSSWSSGQYQQARSYSNTAKILNIVGIVVGSVCWISLGGIIVYQVIYVATYSRRYS